MHFTIQNVTLTDEEALDLIDIAGYGIGYWVDWPALVDDEAVTYTITFTGDVDDPGEPGDSDDERTTVTLTKSDLEAGLTKFFTDHAGRTTDDLGDIDSADGDCIIQYAIFGRLIYG